MEERRKKLLYIMGIDWDWIFQRPQILEQHLEQEYDVTVVFPRSILRILKEMSHTKLPIHYKILWTLPWQEKNKLIGYLSSLLSRKTFREINQYDVVMIGYPLFYRYITNLFKGRIIYDCMDNHKALYPHQKSLNKLIKQEKRLVDDADSIIVSSAGLQQKMQNMILGEQKDITLIRNGTYMEGISYNPKAEDRKIYKIGYFGTIAEWFDYDILLQSLEVCRDIEYHLIGPVRKPLEAKHTKIIMEGVADHQKLYEVTKDYSCLVMPFIINDIVRWVDPVKLYEYIALGKCIISVKYDEIERFNDYVYFYTTPDEYVKLLIKLKESGFQPKYTKEQQIAFLKTNSWYARFNELDRVIEKTLE